MKGDWVFHQKDGEGIKLTTDISTPVGDKTLGFVVPDGTDMSSLVGVVLEAESDALEKGHKFLVDTVTDPSTQINANDIPDNVIMFKEWKDKRNEKAKELQA